MALHSWLRKIIIQCLLGCLLAACSSGQVGDISYNIGVRGEGNQVSIERDSGGPQNKYLVGVTSAQGTGQATVVWWGAIPPHPLEFQVHTNGLESFSLTWGTQTVNVSVNSTDHLVTESLQRQHQDETAIAGDSPFWLAVRVPSEPEAPYQLVAPPAFLQDAPSIWGLFWIDFYR